MKTLCLVVLLSAHCVADASPLIAAPVGLNGSGEYFQTSEVSSLNYLLTGSNGTDSVTAGFNALNGASPSLAASQLCGVRNYVDIDSVYCAPGDESSFDLTDCVGSYCTGSASIIDGRTLEVLAMAPVYASVTTITSILNPNTPQFEIIEDYTVSSVPEPSDALPIALLLALCLGTGRKRHPEGQLIGGADRSRTDE
jgi:hypothetical protein